MLCRLSIDRYGCLNYQNNDSLYGVFFIKIFEVKDFENLEVMVFS